MNLIAGLSDKVKMLIIAMLLMSCVCMGTYAVWQKSGESARIEAAVSLAIAEERARAESENAILVQAMLAKLLEEQKAAQTTIEEDIGRWQPLEMPEGLSTVGLDPVGR